MYFSTTLTLLASGLALASPSPMAGTNAVARDTSTAAPYMTAAIQFAAQADCNLLQCANVVASAGCILGAITAGQVDAVLDCVAGGSNGICPCAGCVSGLGSFLSAYGICT